MDKTDRKRLDLMKLILMMGIIFIHCGLTANVTLCVGNRHAFAFIGTMSDTVFHSCVKAFFILSGYLFFFNIGRAEAVMPMRVYIGKLRSRLISLAVPYILWCTIAGIILVFKARYLGFESYGVIGPDGNVNPVVFMKGYWNLSEGYPMAFAFWFIRNLMVFILLSPIVYLIVRRTVTAMMFFIVIVAGSFYLYGIEYFVFGAWLGGRKTGLFDVKWRRFMPCAAVVYAVALYCNLNCEMDSRLSLFMMLAMNISIFAVLTNVLSFTSMRRPGLLVRELMPSTFFLYAFHQFYCTVNRKFWLHVFGTETDLELLGAYIMSFLSLIGTSWLVYKIMSVTFPRLTSVLTGGRK